jgi:hypothetical protein
MDSFYRMRARGGEVKGKEQMMRMRRVWEEKRRV